MSEKLLACETRTSEFCADCSIGKALSSSKILSDFQQERFLQQYQSGSTIFLQGNDVGLVFFLHKGVVKLSINESAGRNRVLEILSAKHSPCTILDPLSLDRDVHSYTCETLMPSKVFCLQKSRFLRFMSAEFDVNKLAFSAVSRDLDFFLDRLKREINSSGRERLAHLLLSLHDLSGEPGGKFPKITVSLNRQELSSMIGVTRETCSRLLGRFVRSGIISLKKDGIVILQAEQLAKIASVTNPRD